MEIEVWIQFLKFQIFIPDITFEIFIYKFCAETVVKETELQLIN